MSDCWAADATRAVAALAATGRQFTVDEVWAWMQEMSPHETNDAKAIAGVLVACSKRAGVIEPHFSWFMSVRNTDRPIRVWVGTGTPHPAVEPTEDDIVAALTAIEGVGRRRSEIMREQIRATRAAV